MLSRLLLAVCAGTTLLAADPSSASPPWAAAFTMHVRGADRTFVEHDGNTYLLVRTEDVLSGLGDGQDVALTAKLRKLPGDRLGLYRLDGLVVVTVGDALAGRLDGDNLHLVGSISNGPRGRVLRVVASAPAASDAQLLQERLAGIGDSDWDRRIAVANWCQEQAATAGNADFWNATADSLLADIVNDLGSQAAERKDLALVARALDLSLNRLRDHGLAARVCSPPWIREHGGAQAEALARRMRSLGYAIYKEQWLPRAQALEREYDDRFAALEWKDAEGFYRLGRWVDDNAEGLPRARERSWRCYQAGYAADPSHPGIARELGVQPRDAVAGSSVVAAGGAAADFIDLDTGLRVPAPQGWRRGQPSGNATVWTDPGSETAYISVRALRAPLDHEAQIRLLGDEARQRQDFIDIGSSDSQDGDRRVMTLRYTWNDGSQQRFTAVAFVGLGSEAPAAVIEARGLPSEQAALDGALDACIAGTIRQVP